MCGKLHVGLSFIYPVMCNVIITALCVQDSDMGGIRSFKKTVREQLVTGFKLESDGLAESVPVVTFKHLQFLPERIRDYARDHLHELLQDEMTSTQPLTPDGCYRLR